MASIRQIEANRLNAQKSTGPRSDDGKAASRFNSLKHGIDARSLVIPGENPAELEAIAIAYREQFQPSGPFEIFLVDTLVNADWQRRRIARAESQMLTAYLALPEIPAEHPLGAVFAEDAAGAQALHKTFQRLQAIERSYFRALKELRRIQQDRRSAAPPPEPTNAQAPQPQPVRPSAVPQMGGIGFVPSKPLIAPVARFYSSSASTRYARTAPSLGDHEKIV
jgi:hypothetical protein